MFFLVKEYLECQKDVYFKNYFAKYLFQAI